MNKTDRFELRFSPQVKKLIQRAATQTNQSMASFITEAARIKAISTLGAK